MQIKFTRSHSLKGMMSKKRHWKLQATLLLSPQEQELFAKYEKLNEIISFNTDYRPGDDRFSNLTGTFGGLCNGLSWESDNFNELLNFESGITEACRNVMSFALKAETFNGTERVVEIEHDEVKLVAVA